MSTREESKWQAAFVEVVDQRQLTLPPAWIPTHARSARRNERGEAVYESGRRRELAGAVVALLGEARERIVVSSFLLADRAVEDAILAAAERGARVYVLLASEARLGREERDGEFDREVLEQHKAMLQRLGGHVLFRSAPHFHAKVVVIDPHTRPAGLLLSANLTTEALERNEELAVTLTPAEAVEVTSYLRWAMWESAEHELVDPEDRFKSATPLGKVTHPAGAAGVVVTTAHAGSIREELLRLIDHAESRVIVSSFGWDKDHEVVRRLCARAREGLDVTVLARMRPSAMPALLALAEAGAAVFAYRWLHAKAIWTDANQALVMSANLQADGLDHGFELGLRLADRRAAEVRKLLTAWSAAAPWRLEPRPLLGSLNGAVTLWHGERLAEVEIKSSTDVDLGKVTSASAVVLEAPRPPVPANGALPRLTHELRCTWTVCAPVLARNSKERRRPAEGTEPPKSYAPPVFLEPSGRLVVAIRAAGEFERARAVMTEVGAASIVLAEGAAR